jgi:DNA gyrase subunit A
MINRLLKRTEMQTSVHFIHNALVNGQPRLKMSLKMLLENFLEHAAVVLHNKAQFEYNRLVKRLHIISALMKALEDIDKTFELIKGVKNRVEACENLKEAYELDDEQAMAVTAIHLYSLSEEDREKLEKEQETLDKELKRYDNILRDELVLFQYVREELAAIAEQFKNEKRLTEISTETDNRDTIPDMDVVVAYTHNGYIKSVKLDEYNAQKRNGKGNSFKTKEDDFIESIHTLSTHDDMVIITNSGKAYVLPAYKVPTVSKSSVGKPIHNYVKLADGEKVIKFLVITQEERQSDKLILLASKLGIGKLMKLDDLPQTSNGAKIFNLRTEDDELVCVTLVDINDELIVVSSQGQTLRFAAEKVSIMGRQAAGVRIMKLKKDNDYVVDAFTASDDEVYIQITSKGYAKRVQASEIPLKANRGTGGVTGLTAPGRVGHVIATLPVKEGDDCMVVTQNGMIVRTPVSSIGIMSRVANGVKLIKLDGDDRVTSVSIVPTEETDERAA